MAPITCSARRMMVCAEHRPPASEQQSAPFHSRRAAVLGASLIGASLPFLPRQLPVHAAEALDFDEPTTSAPPALDTAFTDKVFMDIGLCPEAVRANRTLGDKSILCSEPELIGRIVISLFGKVVPTTVSNFKAVISAGCYNGTLFSKVLPGQYLMAGRQGSKRSGLVSPPTYLQLPTNPDTLNSKAFQLRHQRPGTVSLNLAQNEDDEYIRFASEYRNTSFLITTGPGPVPDLDGENIVFGQVTEGLDVIAAITTVPTFYPNENLRNFNALGKLIGDERASKTQAKWGQPLKAVVIVNSGVL